MVKQEKKEMRLKAYTIWWNEKLGNVKLHQMIDIEKDAQKRKRLNWKRCPERENDWYEKKDAHMGKECDEKVEKWFTYY